MNRQLTQVPIECLKTIEREALADYIERRGSSGGHDWILVGANENEIQKFSFSPAYWSRIMELWIFPGRIHLDLIDLLGQITGGIETQLEKTAAIADWVYQNVQYIINTEAPPWELVRPGVTGDCSSFAPLVCCFLGMLAIPCWLKQTAFWREQLYSHVYVLAYLPEGWCVVDPTARPVVSREVRDVSAYGLFEVDEAFTEPPIAVPDEPSIFPPLPTWEEFKEMALWLASIGLGLGLVVAAGRK